MRILCPNCNAGLETHGGKNKSKYSFKKKYYYCDCGKIITKTSNKCKTCLGKNQRKVERPKYEQLLKEIKELGYSGTGRKYKVSDNSIRKWKKYYEK